MLNANRLHLYIIPDNATSKYKLILQYITVNAMGYVLLLSAEQTLITHCSVNYHIYHPCIPVSRGSALSLREPLVSGEFLAHLAHYLRKLLLAW